jgi:hypothetical protein
MRDPSASIMAITRPALLQVHNASTLSFGWEQMKTKNSVTGAFERAPGAFFDYFTMTK